MPRNGSGTFTLVSGNPVVTGTTIESNWANTTLSDIATAMTDSLSRSGQGGMTAALRIADGTQGAPGLGFANETGSGLYRAGTAEVWAVVQGAQTMKIDSTGVTVPAAKATSIEGTFVFNEPGADKDARFEGDTDANLLFTDASTDRVGIGTNTPSTKLHVVGDATVSGTVNATTLDLTNLEVTNIKAKDGTASMTLADSTGVATLSANPILDAGTANGVLYLNGSKVATSGSALTFDGTNAATTGTSSATKFIPTGGTATGNGMYLSAANTLGWSTNGTKQLELDSSGNLGLGVTPSAWNSAARAIQISTNASFYGLTNRQARMGANHYYDAGGAFRYISTAAASDYQQWDGVHSWFTAPSGTAGNAISFTQAMTLDASGDLMIGTTTKVPYSGNAGSTNFTLSGTSNPTTARPAITLKNSDDSARAWWVIDANNGAFIGTQTNNYFAFQTNNTERARITSGGDLLVSKTTANLDADPGIELLATGRLSPVVDNSVCMFVSRLTAGGDMITFRVAGSNAASITATTTSVSYNTSSDRRLKKDITPAPQAGADIDAIEIVSHGWIKNDAVVKYGVIAQDLNAIAPAAVTAGDDGDDVEQPWGVDYSKLVPMLIKEIQSLRARVAALEAQP